MTPKEKAKELYNKYSEMFINNDPLHFNTWKPMLSALIAVDEVINFMKMDDEYTGTCSFANSNWVGYWLQVKQELQNL